MVGRLVADAAVTLALVIAHGTVLLGQVANPLPGSESTHAR